jgi:phenylalanine-4-hydroxylase
MIMVSSKLMSMRSKNNGNWLFFEENNTKVYYSLISRNGETLRKGQMSISKETFMEYMEKIGFEYVDSVNVGDVLKDLTSTTGPIITRIFLFSILRSNGPSVKPGNCLLTPASSSVNVFMQHHSQQR